MLAKCCAPSPVPGGWIVRVRATVAVVAIGCSIAI